MANRKLKAENRQKLGSANSCKMRKEGLTPAVVYGHNKETISIQLNTSDFVKLLNRSGTNSVIGIELEEEVVASIVKEIQYHPVSAKVIHVDFQRLEENEKIKLTIPIVFENMETLQNSTVVMSHPLDEIEIQCMPRHIPKHSIHIDIKTLEVGHIVHIKDLDIFKDENIEIFNEDDEIVASLSEVKEMKIEEDETVETEYTDHSNLEKE